MLPCPANRAASHVTSTTNVPGTSTCAASSSDCVRATCTPAARTDCDALAVAVDERLLAAEAAQHAQPCDGVGAEAVSAPSSARCGPAGRAAVGAPGR